MNRNIAFQVQINLKKLTKKNLTKINDAVPQFDAKLKYFNEKSDFHLMLNI